MTRWLITGASGMLGRDLQLALAGHDVTAATRADLDISDPIAVRAAVAGHDVIVNAAAYTRVDDAETDIAAATAVNATGAANLATAAREQGATLIQISTDYVFDGTATAPYQSDAPVHPMSVYGRTKAEGERLALAAHPEGTIVLRTAWLYGAHGENFVSAILRLSATHPEIKVLTDQRGQPTWTADLAERIVDVVENDVPPGIYHATNAGAASRYEFAREIFSLAGLDPERIRPAEGDTFARPAPRPAYSVLSHDGWAVTGLPPLRPWQEALAEAAQA
ncbi:MAG: dTDP-4-dehydrorhamnose reductase, partial [Salinibacterium sp.]